MSFRRIAKFAYVAWMLGAAAWLIYHYTGTGKWGDRPYAELGIQVLDYTVPLEDYREHAGFVWLLNHRKIRPPHTGVADPDVDHGEPWDLAHHYVGYHPTDRDHPQRLSDVELASTQIVYIADTYGVYRDDLPKGVAHGAQMDATPLVFGGLSSDDTQALSDYAANGGLLLAEFNTFCDPTAAAERLQIERVLGVEWTQWVGRVFADPRDERDVPRWLRSEVERQYPGRELPRSPMLLLISRDGHIELLEGASLDAVAPRVVMTPEGANRYPRAPADAPYYFWFGLMRAQPETVVHARLRFPRLQGIDALLERVGAGLEPPALTEHPYQKGRAIYFVGDFSNLDFDPGPYTSVNALDNGARKLVAGAGVTSAPVFWRFYAPVIDQLLEESIARAAEQATHPSARARAH